MTVYVTCAMPDSNNLLGLLILFASRCYNTAICGIQKELTV